MVLYCQREMPSLPRPKPVAAILTALIALFAALEGQSAAASGLDAASIEEMLKAHNDLRRVRRIRPLKWSSTLAQSAQRWAEHLESTGVLEHDRDPRTGQNLYMIHGTTARPAAVVRRWAGEAADYDEAQNSCRPGASCGHLTQMIWAATSELGCGVATGPRGQFWVCNYFPAGNVEGQRPY